MADTAKSSKELHSGDYVRMYEAKPISRISRLVGLMQLDPNSTRLVDLACGNAMLLAVVHDKVAHYTGVDFSEDFITSARNRARQLGVDNCELNCADIVTFCSGRPTEFDVATAFDFSEHVHDDELLEIYSAVYSTLKPGGRFYLHTPNLDFFLEKMRDTGFILRQRPEHIAVRNTAQNVALLERAGFSAGRIFSRSISHYNILAAVHPLRHLPIIGKYFEARIFIECTR